MATHRLRRTLIALVLLIGAAALAVSGFVAGVKSTDDRWVDDMNRLGRAIRRLDQDLKPGGSTAARDADYFLKLSDLPLETFDGKSVTYYVGPLARRSATIEFDEAGVKGVSVR